MLADIKTFESHKVIGLGIETCSTIQNEDEILSVQWRDQEYILQQLDQLFKKYTIDHVKVGVIRNYNNLKAIVQAI